MHETLRDAVLKKTREMSPAEQPSEESIDGALQALYGDNLESLDWNPGMIRGVMQIARRLDMALAGAGKHKEGIGHYTHLTSNSLALSNYYVQKIKPYVEEVRMEVFETSEPPFDSYQKAAEWIINEGNTHYETYIKGNPIIEELHRDLWDKMLQWKVPQELTELTGETINFGFNRQPALLFIYPIDKNNFFAYPMSAWPGSKIALLEKACSNIEKITGFSKLSCTNWILLGYKPILFPLSVEIRPKRDSQFGLYGVQTTININTPDISDKQLREIRKEVRKAWGAENKKLPDALDYEILTMVEEMCGVPEKNKTRFWERACQEWNKRAKLTGRKGIEHNGWQSTRMKYYRAQDKLSNLLTSVNLSREEIAQRSTSYPHGIGWRQRDWIETPKG